MKTHVEIKRVQKATIRTFVLLLLFLMAAPAIPAQAPPNPIPPPETIVAGSLVIPMDNVNQGDAAGTTFNLRAYGLANQLLQNGIPVKWVIKPNKSKDDTDFSASVTKIAQSGAAGPASGNLSFAGGPFVVAAQYDTQGLRDIITNFNGAGTAVTVYKTDADTTADVRYTLTHKPKIAIGPDGGNFGSGVYQGLFDAAGIGNYTVGVDNIDNAGACFTLATQAHQEDPQYVNTYRQFTNAGGNLILQCASINTFENNLNGHFQTTGAGYTVFSSNVINGNPPDEINSNAFVFPEGSMPFNQFLGLLADQDGEITEYKYAPGAFGENGNRVSVHNSAPNDNVFVATVSEVLGPNAGGGVVFELGGHNYARADTTVPGETDSALAMLNGQRMGLNAVFVPARTICTGGAPESVIGYKSVRKTVDFEAGGPPLTPGDTVEWTIDYINPATNLTNQLDFQIQDIINEFNQHLIYVPGSVTVTAYSGANATLNAGFTGAGAGATLDLLAPGAFLPVGGRIRVKLSTQISEFAPTPYDLFNQTTARSLSIAPTALTKSDAIDAANAGIFDQDPPPMDSIAQVQNGAIIDPTKVHIIGKPTAANVSVEGRVLNDRGAGIANALVTVIDAASGETYGIRTNSVGFFRIDSLEAGNFYLITVSHKRYRFPAEPMAITVGEDMTGLTFVGRLPDTKNGRPGVVSTTKSGTPAKPNLVVKSSKSVAPLLP